MAELNSRIDLVAAEAATVQPQARARRSFRWGMAAVYAILGLGLLQALFPFFWMLSTSFMNLSEVIGGRLLPGELRFENYAIAWERANFAQFTWNSIRITAITIAGQLLVCVPAAYAFARMKFVGKNLLFGLMIATLMIPEVATFIPNYLTVIWLGRLSENLIGIPWFNSWPALTIPFMASAFTVFLLRQFFAQIPEDLWDAARIDGASHLRYLLSVVVPLSRAPIMTNVTFAFIGSWNALLWPLLVTQTDAWRPVALGLTNFVSTEEPNQLHLQMAASVIMIVPILVLYFFTQKHFQIGSGIGSIQSK